MSSDATESKNSNAEWAPSSWRNCKILQQPVYQDQEALKKAMDKVKSLPPLVHNKEVDSLKAHLREVCLGKKFLLQGGDCAERFMDCSQVPIENRFKIMLQMSLLIIWGARVPVVRLARMAGQFAKPRSSAQEVVDGKKLPSYKGDNINSFDISAREPDPQRLVEAYFHSAATLNWVRAMIAGGVSDLHDPGKWNLAHIKDQAIRAEYERVIERINDGLGFLSAIQADKAESLKGVEFFTSHEGLLLNYEEALTEPVQEKHYNLGAHFLWIGDRTRQLDGAHVEYFRGIANPIGVKVGPSMKAEELVDLIKILNPDKEVGKLTLITRYGANKVREFLPLHIAAVNATDIPVIWVCDPCHGNTSVTGDGRKTRHFRDMMEEMMASFEIHQMHGRQMGGVHLELTGDDVTECVGGSLALNEKSLSTNYETFCDPRLNYTQSLDMAFAIADQLAPMNKMGLQASPLVNNFSRNRTPSH